MTLQVGPCEPWPIRPCCDLSRYEEEDVEHWRAVASSLLWALSGRRWGPCPVTVRPCRRSCLEGSPFLIRWGATAGPWIPYLGADGQWRNASVCGCKSDCSCGELCEVYLPGPVASVEEVNLDGQVLAPGLEYRVDAPGRLVRLGGGCWPSCQDMSAPPGSPNTLTVTYRWGLPLDAAAIAAVSELTCHLLKGCGSGCGCNATRNVTRLQRQGVEIEADATAIYSEGRTGLPVVDAWLMAVNPYHLDSPSRVYSPDYRRPRVTTWP